MENKFKPSLYNFYYEIENEVIVYNSLTNGLAVIEKNTYNILILFHLILEK
jgi:hypothetical protein